MMSRRRHRFVRALLTLAVALLPIFSGVFGGLHMLLVRHVVCPEHGEFIDASDVAEQNATAFDARADENSSAPHWTGGKQRHAEADEHCLIALVMRASFDSWKGSEARAPIVRGNIALAERDRTAPEAAISRILLAPKHSPPV